jgi:hypothetical protein
MNASGRLLTATGVKTAVDMDRLQDIISNIDYNKVRERRRIFARLYNEARISEEPGKGIGFTAMLMLLAHYKLIEDEEALQYVAIRLDLNEANKQAGRPIDETSKKGKSDRSGEL